MDALTGLLDVLIHLDQHLNAWAADFGGWMYVILFAIVFCETGLVVTPFLPGDSLLFGVGALSATPGSPIDPWLVGILLIVAGILGDAVNYAIGRAIGPKIFNRPSSRFFNTDHLRKAHAFYEKYGGKTIILARFIPIVRTFAPFVAGIGRMTYAKFALYNVTGAIVWVVGFVFLGHQFGGLPFVKKNFSLVILAIIVLSILPAVIEIIRARRASKSEA